MIKFNHGGDKMKIYKAYKFRLYPNKIQQELINKTLGSTRFIYNTMLYEKEKLYKENKMTKQKFDCIKELPLLKQTYPWLMEVDSMALSTTIFDLGNAFKNFYRTKNYPKYKDKYSKNSYRTNYIKNIYKNKELKDLNKRKWTCSKCNNENDRDINAAINIMWEGLINNTKLFT